MPQNQQQSGEDEEWVDFSTIDWTGSITGPGAAGATNTSSRLAWVVMPNHAHVVVWPMPVHTFSDILHSWKSYTSHEINKRVATKVLPFWQSESYEHLIRENEDLHRCCYYTLMNPVNAGFCTRPEDWKWSSGHVAQPSSAASSSTVSVHGTELTTPSTLPGGGTPPKLAGGDVTKI
jgi:hypothetical protein